MAPVFAGLRGRGHGQEADLPQMLHWYGLDIQGVGWGGGLVIVFCMGGIFKISSRVSSFCSVCLSYYNIRIIMLSAISSRGDAVYAISYMGLWLFKHNHFTRFH